MKVIVISEECHGFIGLADTLEHAIDFLMDEGWLDEETIIPVFNDKTTNGKKFLWLKDSASTGAILFKAQKIVTN